MTQLDRRRRTAAGYSLTEILVAMAIFAVIIVAALMIYDRSNRVFKTSMEAGDMQQNTRVAFDKMVAELRMAGYDFDRDGTITVSGTSQQPDEQLEFIGHSAVTFRANLDAESDAANENGREPAYEPTGGQFPVVTTGNDEIVTYALRSNNASANTDSIVFFADTKKRRATFTGTGGVDEQQVTIPNVDLCNDGTNGAWDGCKNPPYTLYRITLKDQDLTNPATEASFVFTPIAENIRYVRFRYFTDPGGTTVVAPNGGTGRYMVTSATTAAEYDARALRESVQSVRLELVGMNAQRDSGYTSPQEMALDAGLRVQSAIRYRQFPLGTHLVPRNLGRRGMQEYDTRPPAAVTITAAPYGCCGVVRVEWSLPPANTGIVDGYSILYDTNRDGPFASTPVQAGLNEFGYVPNLDPAQRYYFVVVTSNSYGSERSQPFPASGVQGVKPINRTKPEPPTIVTASGSQAAGAPAAEANRVMLRWSPPDENVDFNGAQPTLSNGLVVRMIPSPSEIAGYEVHRSLLQNFTPDTQPSSTTLIWKGWLTDTGAPAVDAATGQMVFYDTTAKQNCTRYYYKVRALEKCSTADNLNEPSTAPAGKELAMSDWSNELDGQSAAGAPPAAPQGVAIAAGSSCTATGCTVNLTWPKVTTDTTTPTAASIKVTTYEVRRVTVRNGLEQAGTATEPPFTVTDNPDNGALVTFSDTSAPPVPDDETVYWYTVRATQCGGSSIGAYSSPPKVFPCTRVTVVPPAALDGDGYTPDTAWLIGTGSANVGITTSTDIATVSAQLFGSGPTPTTITSPGQSGPRAASFDIPMTGNNNAVYRLEITVTDVNNCTNTETRYLQDAPSNCCLAPYKVGGTTFDNTVLRQGTTADRIVLRFVNQCGDDLTISGLDLTFRTTGQRKLESITYPNTTGGTVTQTVTTPPSSPVSVTTLPTGARTTITGESSTYEVILDFDRSTAVDAIEGFCVTYTGATTTTQCRIAQEPSSNGTCSP